MASMKITVDELRYRKTVYSKAAKNLREVIEIVKTAKKSIGNDRMFSEARQSLGKLAENMDRRATVLEALAEALTYSADTYKGAQTHSVSVISDFKAHKTDFYGRPVQVSAAPAASAAAAATAVKGSASAHLHSEEAVPEARSSSQPASGSSSKAGSFEKTGNASGSMPETGKERISETAGSISESYTENNTVINNITNNTVVYKTENYIVNETVADVAAAADTVAEGPTVQNLAAEIPSDTVPESVIPVSEESSGISGAAMAGAGIAAAAVAGAAAFGVTKILKDKNEEESIDTQLEDAKKKLKEIEDEQDMLVASMLKQSEDEG